MSGRIGILHISCNRFHVILRLALPLNIVGMVLKIVSARNQIYWHVVQ